MGANYDFVISSADAIEERIEGFLSRRDLAVISAAELGTVEIDDDKVILIGPSQDGLVQVVVHCSAVGIDLTDWYDSNPLAAALSQQGQPSLHLWSLDSGFVSGYSAYRDGVKVEADHCFSIHAKNKVELMESVATPRTQRGNTLQTFLRKDESTVTSGWKKDGDLELGMASLVAKMGFDVHLVDLYDALDDHEGVAVSGDNYQVVELSAWKAVLLHECSK